MKIPKYLTTVTPFSKYLALSLFVILPFTTFILGYNAAKIPVTTVPQPAPITAMPTPTTTPTPTILQKQIYFTPTPTTPTYKYILWKSNDEIHLTVPTTTGYAIYATLRDEKMNIVTNQADYTYKWSTDDSSLIKGEAPFSGCTQGIQPPCPDDHYSFAATQSGQTVIRVSVSKNNQVVAATTFPLIIEKK